MARVVDQLSVSERRACRVLRQSRATQRYLPDVRDDEEPLTGRIIEIAAVYGRYGTPRVTNALKTEGGGGEFESSRLRVTAGRTKARLKGRSGPIGFGQLRPEEMVPSQSVSRVSRRPSTIRIFIRRWCRRI